MLENADTENAGAQCRLSKIILDLFAYLFFGGWGLYYKSLRPGFSGFPSFPRVFKSFQVVNGGIQHKHNVFYKKASQ